jgi:hypothetical protein
LNFEFQPTRPIANTKTQRHEGRVAELDRQGMEWTAELPAISRLPATGEAPNRSERERSSRSVVPPAAAPMARRFRLGRTYLWLGKRKPSILE